MSSEGLSYTPIEEIAGIVQRCRNAASDRVLLPVKARKEALRAVMRMLKENERAFQDALHADLDKSPLEAQAMEISTLYTEIVHLINHVDEWSKEMSVPADGIERLMSCAIRYDPLGCVLIIGAFNYPLILTLNPLVGALCAGNTVVLKPSELSPSTAQLLADMLPKYVDSGIVSVVNGAIAETTELLQNNVFDHIFYTGSGTVARIVMAAAAKNLTPVTLELGGKSPTIIDETCAKDMDIVAARVLWGKYMNSGQTCVAPDYVLIHSSVKDAFVDAFAKRRLTFMEESPSVAEDLSYGRLVNQRHYDRVAKLLDGSCGRVVVGGEMDRENLKIGVTLVDDVDLDSPLMQEEIFGPLLPIIPYDTDDEALEFVQSRPKPLALYVFSQDSAFVRRVKTETSSGGLVVNDVMLHVGLSCLPFGGVGESGMGSYHGRASFENFSHRKAIVNDTLGFEFVKSLRYPPYTADKLRSIRRGIDPWGEKSAPRRVLERVVTLRNAGFVLCFAVGAVFAFLITKYAGRTR